MLEKIKEIELVILGCFMSAIFKVIWLFSLFK